MRYTISEMASLLGVTTHTLRYYEKMGLIHPEVNEDTGYRYYTVTDTRRFNLCRELRAAELSLEECRELIGAPTVEQSDAMFNHQIAQLRRRQVLDELAIRFFGTQAGAVPHTGTECWAHLGEEFPGNVATDLLTGRSSRPG